MRFNQIRTKEPGTVSVSFTSLLLLLASHACSQAPRGESLSDQGLLHQGLEEQQAGTSGGGGETSNPQDAGGSAGSPGDQFSAGAQAMAGAPALDQGGQAGQAGAPAASAGTTELTVAETVTLNEVNFDPPGADADYEFIELAGKPGASLVGYSLLSIEGDAESVPGQLDRVLPLGDLCLPAPCRLGENGLLLLVAPNGVVPPAASLASVATASELARGGLENGTNTLLVVSNPDTSLESMDADPTDDGSLTLPAGTVIHDAIAWTDGGVGDIVYSETILGPKPAAQAAWRCGSSGTAEDWRFGQISGDASSLVLDSAKINVAAPIDPYLLTPGEPNDCRLPPTEATGGAPTLGQAGSAGLATEPGTTSSGGKTTTEAGAGPVPAGGDNGGASGSAAEAPSAKAGASSGQAGMSADSGGSSTSPGSLTAFAGDSGWWEPDPFGSSEGMAGASGSAGSASAGQAGVAEDEAAAAPGPPSPGCSLAKTGGCPGHGAWVAAGLLVGWIQRRSRRSRLA